MAFRKKAGFILKHLPDILIVPECEHPDKLIFNKDIPPPTDVLWYGTNKNKGLAIFSYSNYKLELLKVHNPEIKFILPVAVTNGAFNFTLFAIWAYNPFDKDYNYIGQVWKAINHYQPLLKSKNVILTGDFNSNVFWDKLNRKTNHSMVVEQLAALKIFSTYHFHLNIKQGAEAHPTFFLYRHLNKPYHIDYCFASANLLKKIENVTIGSHKDWAKLSDHSPLMVSFKV